MDLIPAITHKNAFPVHHTLIHNLWSMPAKGLYFIQKLDFQGH